MEPHGTTSTAELLRQRGERATPARRAVLDVLAVHDHLDAEAIVAAVAVRAPGVHRATVYRALATLGELGLVRQTHLGGPAAVYHLGRSEPHLHARCTDCGRLTDVEATAIDAVRRQLATAYGFELDASQAALLGRCRDCR